MSVAAEDEALRMAREIAGMLSTCDEIADRSTPAFCEQATPILADRLRPLLAAAVPLCIGRATIAKLAAEGQYLADDGRGLIAADDLFHADPWLRAERAEAEVARLREERDAINSDFPHCSRCGVVLHCDGADKEHAGELRADRDALREAAREAETTLDRIGECFREHLNGLQAIRAAETIMPSGNTLYEDSWATVTATDAALATLRAALGEGRR